MAVQDDSERRASLYELYAKKFLLILRCVARVPKVDHKAIRTVIKQATANEQNSLELQHEELKTGELSRTAVVSIIASVLYSFKNFLGLVRTATWFKYYDTKSDLRTVINSSSNLANFACMTTNCSRLISDSSGSLVDDMAELPVFAICDPFAGLFAVPVKYLKQIGVLYFALTALSSLLDGTFITAMQWLRPAGNECLVFLQSPDIGVEIIKKRVRDMIRVEFVCSYERFVRPTVVRYPCEGSLAGQFERQALMVSPAEMGENTLHPINQRALRARSWSGSQYLKLDRNHSLRAYKEQFIDGCVPVVRSQWFRANMLRYLVTATICNLVFGSIIATFSYVVFFQPLVEGRAQQFQEFSSGISKQNCSIWLRSNAHDQPASFVDFARFDLNWNLFGVLEAVLLQLIPCHIVISMVLVFYMTNVELICWQSELHNQLLLLVDCKRLVSDMNDISAISPPSKRLTFTSSANHIPPYPPCNEAVFFKLLLQSRSLMAVFREKFQEANKYVSFLSTGLIGLNRPIDPDSSRKNLRALQELSTSLLIDQDESNSSSSISHNEDRMKLILIMERVYINFRLYLDHIDHYTPCISMIISFCYALFYSFVLVAIWYCKRIDGSILESMAIISIGWALTNGVLLIASRVHAKGKRLHPLIWSLIAQLHDSQNQQEHYLRYLWLKQIKHIDKEGGVALKAMGIKITYVKVIQVIVSLSMQRYAIDHWSLLMKFREQSLIDTRSWPVLPANKLGINV